MITGGTIASWTDLTHWFDRYREQGWLFRGEIREHKNLRPKIGRVGSATGSPRKVGYTAEDEARVLREFKKAARPYLSYEPRTTIEWLALGQHHGLPTRLLDWTESLMVAAFFAVEKAGKVDGKRVDPVIYCVRSIPELKEAEEDNVFSLSEVRRYHPPHISPRIPAQRSVFTIHPSPTESLDHPTLERWTIGTKACWQLKRALNAASINYGAMAPDIDGLCRQIEWMYKWGFFERSKAAESR